MSVNEFDDSECLAKRRHDDTVFCWTHEERMLTCPYIFFSALGRLCGHPQREVIAARSDQRLKEPWLVNDTGYSGMKGDDEKKAAYGPFILLRGDFPSLILAENHMASRSHIFEALGGGWKSNGCAWTSIAHILIHEKLPGLKNKLSFDSSAGIFFAHGPLDALEQLGREMKQVFENEDLLYDLLRRANLIHQ